MVGKASRITTQMVEQVVVDAEWFEGVTLQH
jgi:hypothetical protein